MRARGSVGESGEAGGGSTGGGGCSGGGGGGYGGGGLGHPELVAIIQAAVGSPITATMIGVADIKKGTVEARATAADSGNGILSVRSVHLCHICYAHLGRGGGPQDPN